MQNMNTKETLATATFLVFYTGFIFAGFGWMLTAKISPLETRMDRIETRIDRIETRMDRMETRMETRMDRMESMLSQILIAQNTHHKGKAKTAGQAKKTGKTKVAQHKTASQETKTAGQAKVAHRKTASH